MKKLVVAIATALVAGNLFAISITGGLVYAYSDVRTLDTSTLVLTKESETTNKIGAQVGVYNGLLGPIGIFADVQALFPMSSVITDENGHVQNFKPSSNFDINTIIGPALAFDLNDVTRIKIGAGLDIGFNTSEYSDSENAVFKTHTFKYGVGAKVDADIMLLGFLGINVGCDVGAIWGTKNITIDKTNVSSSSTTDYDNTGSKKTFNLLVLPSISAVIKLGN